MACIDGAWPACAELADVKDGAPLLTTFNGARAETEMVLP